MLHAEGAATGALTAKAGTDVVVPLFEWCPPKRMLLSKLPKLPR